MLIGKHKGGGDEENRTPDPLLARQVLSQLSYAPTVFDHLPRHVTDFIRVCDKSMIYLGFAGGPKWT